MVYDIWVQSDSDAERKKGFDQLTSLEEYYTDLEQEMRKSLDRPGLSAQLIQERQKKD